MKRQAATTIPTKWGVFKMIAYAASKTEAMPHLAMVHEDFDKNSSVHLRIHSECLTGDLFTSKRCDCGQQLSAAMEMAASNGGVVIYLRQEGRGIGLINKMEAYNIQDTGVNTADANTHLGFDVDSRHYEDAITIMEDLQIKSIHLITNNPLKIEAIEKSNIEVASRVPLIIKPIKENRDYLKTKNE